MAAAAPAAAAEEGQIIDVNSLDAWKEFMQNGEDAKQLVIVDFTASWSGQCRLLAPFLVEIAKKLPNVMFLKVDVDKLQTITWDWKVEEPPTFFFLKEGMIVDMHVGADIEALQAKITKHAV